jgi:hypothetical protein
VGAKFLESKGTMIRRAFQKKEPIAFATGSGINLVFIITEVLGLT